MRVSRSISNKKRLSDNLRRSYVNRNDEFYTRYEDIEKELRHYVNCFKGKIVYCPCDVPASNFVRYFLDKFDELKLKKLIATSYKPSQTDLFNLNRKGSGTYFSYDGTTTINTNLKGTGSYRSKECIGILKDADVVVTNPPFSLFRHFFKTLINHKKEFLIIGNITACTYTEVFPFIKANRVWWGYNRHGYMRFFNEDCEKQASTVWYSNINKPKKHLELTKSYNEKEYMKYDNYNVIEVSRCKDIPKDYKEKIGVPITFLNHYNENQFNILRILKGAGGIIFFKRKELFVRLIITLKQV